MSIFIGIIALLAFLVITICSHRETTFGKMCALVIYCAAGYGFGEWIKMAMTAAQ